MSSASIATRIALPRDVFVALAAVAWADGTVAPEEAAALRRAAGACGVTGDDLAHVESCTQRPVDLSDLGELDLSHDAKLFVYALATWMAESDGVVVDAEVDTLNALRSRLALSEHDIQLATATRLDPTATTADLNQLATIIEMEARAVREEPPLSEHRARVPREAGGGPWWGKR